MLVHMSDTNHPTSVTFQTLASGSTAEVHDGKVVSIWRDTKGCDWTVERPNPLLTDPEAQEAGWYPDFPTDMVVIEPCGGRIEPGATTPHCPHHHHLLTMDGREFEALMDAQEPTLYERFG